jgi:DNA-binding transcriptional regulator YiaG
MTVRHAWSLRAALTSHEPGRGKRYSPALKARIIEFAQSRRSEGASWAQISADIGVAFETLRRWCTGADSPPSRAMVPVRVVADRAESTVSVVSAGGHRISGLTLQEAVAVLRALG